MAKKNTTENIKGVAAGITMAASVLPLVKPAIDAGKEYIDKAIEERKKLVAVPPLYSKDYPLTVEQAVEVLESCGLKATLVKTSLSDANVMYRNCFDGQVIKSQPKTKQKVEPGTSVLVKYITQEIIDESLRLFEQQQEARFQKAVEKEHKASERKAKTQQMISTAVATTKQTFNKIKIGKGENEHEG